MTTDLKLVLDNRINISEDSTKLVSISGLQTNNFSTDAQGSTYASTISFVNLITPSISNTVLSKNFRIRYLLTVSGTTAVMDGLFPNFGAVLAVGPTCAPRAFPLASIASNISVVLNGTTMNLDSRQSLSQTQRRFPKEWLQGFATESPSMADNCACLINDVATMPSSNQPLSNYYNSSGYTRGSFMPLSYARAGGGNSTVIFEICEPVLCSPLVINDQDTYLANISTLSLTYTYNYLMDMLSFADSVAVPVVAVALSYPRLELTYIQTSADVVQIPRVITTGYENVICFSKAMEVMTGTNTLEQYSITGDMLRLSATPALIYVCYRPQLTARTGATESRSLADACLNLGPMAGNNMMPGFNITFGNRTGLLNGMSCKGAYQMSKRNGYNGSYNEWNLSGSWLIINPTLDFGLNLAGGDTVISEAGQVNFQFSATYNNSNYVNSFVVAGGENIAGLALSLDIVVVYAGRVTISPDNCVPSTGDISASEVATLIKSSGAEQTTISTEALDPTIKAAGLFSRKTLLGHGARSSHSHRKTHGGRMTVS